MALFPPAILSLRRDPRILKVPPYLSAFCIIVGVVWLILLPLNEYSRQTYISENALLPGQVHTYFGGSEHNVFRAYRHEIAALADQPGEAVAAKLESILRSCDLKVARQRYEYRANGKLVSGINVYAVLHGPRADATEAAVLIGPWTNMDGVLNHSGVALVLTLARYFKRWSLWSKDIIFLITGDSTVGPQAWVDAYHDTHSTSSVEPLPLKSGALQGAVAIDYPAGPWGHRFDKVHIIYDGVNGQLPNLDLFNTAVSIASGQLGIGVALQRMWTHGDGYTERLRTMLRGMINQAIGHASGPHSSFIPYHIDAITLQTVGDGWHDEMSLGRLVESLFRSLNNLLEHFHQSFFFYLLMQANRFVSIGTYLPSAMLIAMSFTITSIALWIESGRPRQPAEPATLGTSHLKEQNMTVVKGGENVALIATATLTVVERQMFLPVIIVSGVHFVALVPLYMFNHSPDETIRVVFLTFASLSCLAPHVIAFLITRLLRPSWQAFTLIRCFSLLLLGMFLSALATLNFSLAFLVGLLAAPLSVVQRAPDHPRLAIAASIVLNLFSPATVVLIASRFWGVDFVQLLQQAALGWHIWGMRTQLVVWLVWWPAWLAGAVSLASSPYG